MRRLTISIDDDVADRFDRLVKERGYANRSEAFRDLVRGELGRDQLDAGTAKYCVGTLSYVYNHHERQLAARLMTQQHDHHDIVISSMHAHLDHDNCIETVILRGPTDKVLEFARRTIAEKGVRNGRFHPIPVVSETLKQFGKGHVHLHPLT